MKKFALLFVMVAAVAMVSCGGGKAKRAAEAEPAVVETEMVETTASECCAEGEECAKEECTGECEHAETTEETSAETK